MEAAPCWQLSWSRTRLVEPVRDDDTRRVRYRALSEAGLIRPVEAEFGASRLVLSRGGALTVQGANLRLDGTWQPSPEGFVLSASAVAGAVGAWHTFDGLVVGNTLYAVVVDGVRATVAQLTGELVQAPPGFARRAPSTSGGLARAPERPAALCARCRLARVRPALPSHRA